MADGLGGHDRGSEDDLLVRKEGDVQCPRRRRTRVKEGEQIVLGGNESYTSLCRKHWQTGDLGAQS